MNKVSRGDRIPTEFFEILKDNSVKVHSLKVKEVTQSCLILCDPMDCSLPGSSVHGIFQERVLEWVAISFSRGSSWPRDRTQVSCTAGRRFTVWATREAQSTLTMSANLESSAVATGLKKFCFHSSQKESQCQNTLKLLYNFTHFTC